MASHLAAIVQATARAVCPVLFCVLAACGNGLTDPAQPLPTPPAEANAVLDLARADLAKTLAMDSKAIQTVRVTEANWPNSALGCPEPGQMYLQVITPGWTILLLANGTTYEYHANRESRVVRCDGK